MSAKHRKPPSAGARENSDEPKDSGGDLKREPYSPERLDTAVQNIRDVLSEIAGHAAAMRSEKIEAVLIGDAMFRRSYKHISNFSSALERAIEKIHDERGEAPRAPW